MNWWKAGVLAGGGALALACAAALVPGAPPTAPEAPAPVAVEPPAAERSAPPAAWPKTLADAEAERAAAANPAPPAAWAPEEIAAARARCDAVLKGLDIAVSPEPPLREGSCGAPAPVRLASVGKSPRVSFSPPALVTCDLAAALHAWVQRDLQPLAREHLGSDIATIETMSDYACRNVYGQTRGRRSEHSRVNALDIRGFVTARARAAAVLAGWGPTARDLKTQLAAAAPGGFVTTVTAEPETPAAAKPEASPPRAVAAADPLGGFTRSPWTDGASKTLSGLGFKAPQDGASPPPLWLGGPKPAAKTSGGGPLKAAANGGGEDGLFAFLHAAHRSACRIFGTVLGPEANAAHRNHFHVDMALRPRGSFCQ